MGTGVETVDPDIYVPLRSYPISVPDDNVPDLYNRVLEYAAHSYKVSWYSLLKCLALPCMTHYSLCTSFVSYVLTGTIHGEHCNSMIKFENYVRSIGVINELRN